MQYYEYVEANGVHFFIVVCLPDNLKQAPTFIMRTPYNVYSEEMTDEEVAQKIEKDRKHFLDAGYAFVYQHCRGKGRSDGTFVPYLYEREDGLALQEWVRKQPFYNGEIFLGGGSYNSAVHLATAPFAKDIKGVVIEVMDSDRYNPSYRNGFYKSGLQGWWYAQVYKNKKSVQKNYVPESFNMMPLSDFSLTVFGERAENFDEILRHPDKNDAFWNTKAGCAEYRGALDHANIPVLLVTGFYDIFVGGIFEMWKNMDASTRAKSAFVVHPYNHDCKPESSPVRFENASLSEKFGNHYLRWIEFVRGKEASPVDLGKVTYYSLFGNTWATDDFSEGEKSQSFTLGKGEKSYVYNPYSPASFKGGLSCNFGGTDWQDAPNSRYDIISVYTPEFTEDTLIKGKIKANLKVRSTAEDTCFYMRLSLVKPEGDYGLRDDINQISNFTQSYTPGSEMDMYFEFDPLAVVVKKGEKIRMDISSSAFPHYVAHKNKKGLFSEHTTATVATNTVVLDLSTITFPISDI